MRRTLALFALFTVALISSAGCGTSDRSGAANSNAPGTTSYSNTSATMPTTPAAPPRDGAAGGGAAPQASPTAPKIKPPTD